MEKKISHFLLFHGGSSSERSFFGIKLAQILNCLSPKETGACGECNSCRKITSGNHPDIDLLKPQKTSLGIEQILIWQDKVFRKHYEGQFKVFIIEKADLLTVAAGNALLKIVEEPPERTILILSADNVEQILPTLQSRAQIIYFSLPSKEVWIKGLEGYESLDIEEAYRLSNKNIEIANQILTLGVNNVRDWIRRFREVIREENFLGLFALFPIEKEQANTYLIVLANVLQEEMLNGNNHAEQLQGISKAMERLRQQVNPRLVIEVLALELFQRGGKKLDRGCGR